MKRKSFENWLWEDLEIEFGLAQTQLDFLNNWIENAAIIEVDERKYLDFLHPIFLQNYQNWNEEELKMGFIAPLLTAMNYYETGLNSFAQRSLSAVVGDWELHGRVDWMLAKGKQSPRGSYFFLHEYKSERGRDRDPQGQLLAEMLVAQTKNADGKPIYGIYTVGKDWYFVVLFEKNYDVSRPYFANEKDDFQLIVKALKHIKTILRELLK